MNKCNCLVCNGTPRSTAYRRGWDVSHCKIRRIYRTNISQIQADEQEIDQRFFQFVKETASNQILSPVDLPTVAVLFTQQILNIRFTKRGSSYVNSLLQVIQKFLTPHLPKTLHLPSTEAEALRICQVDVSFKTYLLCPNECSLQSTVDVVCSVCGHSLLDETKKPLLAFRQLSIIDRLQLMFQNEHLSKLLRYPYRRRNPQDKIESLFDGEAWKDKFLSRFPFSETNIALSLTFGKSIFFFFS
jgi:hypothetical protein